MTRVYPIRIAIVGGGIAGAALFQALLRSDNNLLDLHLFEAVPAFQTAGYFISFGPNAVAALDLLGLRERLTATNPVRSYGQKFYIASGKDTGKLAYTRNIDKPTARGNTVQRSRFLVELFKGIDESRVHLAKRLKSVSQSSSGEDVVTLHFDDGSTHTCDILIGADGIHSTVRKHILGADDPAATQSFTGWQNLWTEVPVAEAIKYLGKDLINVDDHRAYSWCGHKTWMMHNMTQENTRVSCILVHEVDYSDSSRRKISKAELEEWMKTYDAPIGKAMISLLTRDGINELDVMPLQHHDPQASRYVRDSIAMVGDAADATTPFRASAGSLALEDALILGNCFKKVTNLNDAKAALRAYEIIQRPRRARLVKDSYGLGKLAAGCDENVGLDAEKMGKALEGSWDWIQEIDLKQQVLRALELMEAEKKKS